MQWEVVIGLEVHAQLLTRSKIFSGASTRFGAEPNTQACPVDLGLPGTLPVLNRQAVEHAIRFGLAIGAQVAPVSIFARKNYFYPDLPKGYQISQYEQPVVLGGTLDIAVPAEKAGDPPRIRTINLTRAHLEEDAGKSLHEDFAGMSGIDLNRQRLGPPAGPEGIRHPRRDQEPELVPLPGAGHPVRGAPPDRADRGRWPRGAGNPALRSGCRRDPLDAHQGRRG